MSIKRKSMAPSKEIVKKRRKVIDHEMKMNITQDYNAGKMVKKIVYNLKLTHLTISIILKDKVRAKEVVFTLTLNHQQDLKP